MYGFLVVGGLQLICVVANLFFLYFEAGLFWVGFLFLLRRILVGLDPAIDTGFKPIKNCTKVNFCDQKRVSGLIVLVIRLVLGVFSLLCLL